MSRPRNDSRDLPPLNEASDGRSNHVPTVADERSKASRSRVGGLWIAGVLFAAILLVLLIFILQNGQRANVSFFGAHGHLPLGVALLLAATFGVLLVAVPGTARIVQLRMSGHRLRRGRPAPTPRDDPAASPSTDGTNQQRRPQP
jgi:lipopolysaccharide assembly protein A